MPYSSTAQERLMRAVAHSPGFAKKVGIPQAVGRKFEAHKAEGGPTMKKESPEMVKKEMAFMKKKGAPKSMVNHEMAEAGMKKGGKVKKMAGGGLAPGHKAADGIAKKGKTRGMEVKMAGGGYKGKC